tara:strand:- start:2524 stop:2898 length:375 start_codon:yes stop_codon:yes gene_type:complete
LVEIPVITLVIKSHNCDSINDIGEDNSALLSTLSMLCSFLSVDDFCSFIYSTKFGRLIDSGYRFLFEIGVYARHDIILQMAVMEKKIILSDIKDQQLLPSSQIECSNQGILNTTISNWLSVVFG